MKSQKQVWNNLAQDWYELKNNPIKRVMDFLSKQQGKVLDFGSGAGRHLTKIKNGKMYLADFSEKMIELAKKKLKGINKDLQNSPLTNCFPKGGREGLTQAEFFVSPMTKLQFPDNFFDAAICTSSFHCIKGKSNREKSVKELFRVLKPKAKVIITVYNKNSEQFKNSSKEKFIKWKNKEIRYYYIFNEKEIHRLFEKCGFKIVKQWEPKRSIEFIAEKG